MEPIANCMHAIPKPYRFQYEKCKKKSWELQAYTYTAFVAPLHYYMWQTDIAADRATLSVTIGHIYVRSIAMRPNDNSCDNVYVLSSWPRLMREFTRFIRWMQTERRQPSCHASFYSMWKIWRVY